MRNRGSLAVALAVALSVTLFTVSCSRKAVRTQTETRADSRPPDQAPVRSEARTQPQSMAESNVRKPPDSPAEKAGQAARPEANRPPAAGAPREAAEWVFVNEQVHFAFASSLLSDEARRILHGKADYLRTNPAVTVTVEGHCDDRGTNAYNIALGERRAASVKGFLVGLGIGTDRLKTVSYGEERPTAAGHDEDAWARNRRARFVIN